MLTAVTTDNGANIVLATDILNWPRMPCFSHSLHLAVEAATKRPQVSRALAHSKCLVGHFHHSAKSSYTLADGPSTQYSSTSSGCHNQLELSLLYIWWKGELVSSSHCMLHFWNYVKVSLFRQMLDSPLNLRGIL